MGMRKRFRKIISGGFGITALTVQPACAAVCPRGRSECPFPGRCSLYIDADGNSLCDYTSADIEAKSGMSSLTGTADSGVPDTVNNISNITSAGESLSDGGRMRIRGSGNTADSVSGVNDSLSGINPSDIFSFILIAIAMSAIFYLIYMKINNKNITENKLILLRIGYILPPFAVLYIFLNNPEIAGIPDKTADIIDLYFGMIYLAVGTVIAGFLHKKGRMGRDVSIPFLILTVLVGFLFVAPLAPDGFSSHIRNMISGNLVTLGFISLVFISVTVLISGRVFCGQICPVGAVQELLSGVPVKKIKVRNNKFPKLVRASVFIVLAAGGILSFGASEYTGTSYFFGLLFYSAGFFIFLVFLIISAFVYRPFCRFICPYGLIFSILGIFSRNKIIRTESCINCGKCEKICPAGVAGRYDNKDECYLCGRCLAVCPVDGALKYELVNSDVLVISDGSGDQDDFIKK